MRSPAPPKQWRNRLIDWMHQFYEHSDEAKIHWKMRDPHGQQQYREGIVTGLATCTGRSFYIEVFCPPGRLTKYFPRGSETPGAPMAIMLDADEEIVIVLAHELRHIDQMYERMEFPDEEAEEADAEIHAIMVLDRYRTWRQHEESESKA